MTTYACRKKKQGMITYVMKHMVKLQVKQRHSLIGWIRLGTVRSHDVYHGLCGYHILDFFPDEYTPEPKPTGVSMETLKQIGSVVSSTPPREFTVHPGML